MGRALASDFELPAAALAPEALAQHLVLVGGAPASGKTTVAKLLAERLGGIVLRLGPLATEAARRPAGPRRAAAAPMAAADRLSGRIALALQCGLSVVLELGRPLRQDEGRTLERLATQQGASLLVLGCQAAEPVRQQRLQARARGAVGAMQAMPADGPALVQADGLTVDAQWIDTAVAPGELLTRCERLPLRTR